MELTSTRSERIYSVEEALLLGYSEDGGLINPKGDLSLPWKEWGNLTYHQLVIKLVSQFWKEPQEICEVLSSTYDSFTNPDEVLHLYSLSPNCHVAEMFHGPTWSFKDYALTPLLKLLQHILHKKQQKLTVLVVDTDSDGCDDILRPIFAEKESLFGREINISSVNSICWGRIMIQMAHYFYLYLKQCEKVGDTVTIVVPTGAAGNIAAGFLAHSCGLPIKLVACTNDNDIAHEFITTGLLKNQGESKKTLANAMDIQVPYNLERIVFVLSNGNHVYVKEFMETFYKTGEVQLKKEYLDKMQSFVTSAKFSDAQILETMKWTKTEFDYEICPHTATAVAWWKNNRSEKSRTVCISTASPEKFPEALKLANLTLDKESDRLKELKSRHKGDVTFMGNDVRGQWQQKIIEAIREINK